MRVRFWLGRLGLLDMLLGYEGGRRGRAVGEWKGWESWEGSGRMEGVSRGEWTRRIWTGSLNTVAMAEAAYCFSNWHAWRGASCICVV